MTRSSAPDLVPVVRRPLWLLPIDVVRGFLIGMAELVPGVSGGTVALVTGVYEQLIGSANHVVTGLRRLVAGPDRWRGFVTELRRTDWLLIIPVLVGMAAAVLGMAGIMSSFVTGSPELARGLFLGMVAASVVVPLRMLPARKEGRPAWVEALTMLAAIVAAFVMTSFAGGAVVEDPLGGHLFRGGAPRPHVAGSDAPEDGRGLLALSDDLDFFLWRAQVVF